MERTRWTWFAFGLVLGLVLGGSAVGTYYAVQLHQARQDFDRMHQMYQDAARGKHG